jgi:signal transduction histidine kinase
MTNTAFIERKTYPDISKYLSQINASINMLSNAYEDLSYIISHKQMVYTKRTIHLSLFLQERVDFFTTIAQARNKQIVAHITPNIYININDTQLERLIDNNLSNAIKHSTHNSTIKVALFQRANKIFLIFLTQGAAIKDTKKIFQKNFTQDNSAKRSLGLGLYMVKEICLQNRIDYCVYTKPNSNKFCYIFIKEIPNA